MGILRRAFLYIFRKWKQSMILFFVLLAVCTSALICFAVLKASDTAVMNLRKQFGGTFSMEIDLSNPVNMQSAWTTEQYTGSYYQGDIIDHNVIGEVLKTEGIADYSANIESAANLKSAEGEYCNLVENSLNFYSSPHAHIASIQGWSSLRQCPYFANHILEIIQGRMFTEGALGQAVISRELAERNHLVVGDRITLETNREVTGIDFPAEKQECTFEIIGIFDVLGEQQIGQYTGQRQMLQNWVFVDSRTLLPYLNELLASIGMPPMGYEKVTFSVEDPAEMESIIKDIRQNKAIDWNCFKVSVDNTNYENAEQALNSMDRILCIMILSIALSGVVILILLLNVWTKSRVNETGILLAVGKGKGEILAQRIMETMLIALMAAAVSYVVSITAASEVGNRILVQANERNSEEAEAGTGNLGMSVSGSNFDLSPVFFPAASGGINSKDICGYLIHGMWNDICDITVCYRYCKRSGNEDATEDYFGKI